MSEIEYVPTVLLHNNDCEACKRNMNTFRQLLEHYERLLKFVHGMSKKSCCNLHCYSCDAIELLEELGE